MRALVGGNPSTLRLSGKPPITVSVVSCLPSPVLCTVIATWDFTEEARQVSAQGGGELVLTPNPVAPVVQQGPGFSFSTGTWSFSPAVNYAWQHGGADNALTIIFEATCPREITLLLTPGSVRPQIPEAQLTGALRNVPTQSTVEAVVRSCPSQPGSVEVKFEIQSPMQDTANDGGHAHDGLRPSGRFAPASEPRGQRSSCVAVLDGRGRGSCTVTYHSSEVGQVETIVASAAGFPTAEANVKVTVPDLIELPENPARYVLVGTPNNHSRTNDPCRRDVPQSLHFRNHFGQKALKEALEVIADEMRKQTGITLRVNDMSLPLGGLFDFENSWRPPHRTHRIGRAVDIEFFGLRGGVCVTFDLDRLERVIRNVVGKAPAKEGNHFHATVP